MYLYFSIYKTVFRNRIIHKQCIYICRWHLGPSNIIIYYFSLVPFIFHGLPSMALSYIRHFFSNYFCLSHLSILLLCVFLILNFFAWVCLYGGVVAVLSKCRLVVPFLQWGCDFSYCIFLLLLNCL